MQQFDIHLHNVKFFAYHGIHDHEQHTGGDYEINLTASYTPAHISIHHIADTVDYTALYEIVRLRMEQPTPLLETIATDIAVEIITKFPAVSQVSISVSKLSPPIPGFNGSVGVSFTLKRD